MSNRLIFVGRGSRTDHLIARLALLRSLESSSREMHTAVGFLSRQGYPDKVISTGSLDL